MDEDLARFVDHAREKGMDLPGIRLLLLSAGWKEKQIAAAFSERALDLPVPEPPVGSSARDTFFHMLAFTALYTWVISLILLCFQYINLAFPDPAWEGTYYSRERIESNIRAALAALVVAFPVFLVVWRHLLKEIYSNPEKAKSPVRRWLTYGSLFVGAVTLLSDVIALVYRLFEGELTTRFLLKVVVLALITGTAFVYLALTLRSVSETKA